MTTTIETQCEAYIVISPTATLEERKCNKEVGEWTFTGSNGTIKLCDSHAKSYRDSGYVLDKAKQVRQD